MRMPGPIVAFVTCPVGPLTLAACSHGFCAVDTTGRDSSSLDIQAEPTIAVDGGDVDAAAYDPFTQGVVWVQGRGIFYARDGVCKGARIGTLPRELWPVRSMHANARGGVVILSASGAVALLLLPAVSGRDFSEPRILVNSSATAVAVDAARGLIFVAFKDRTVRLLLIEVTGEVQRVPVLQRESLRLQQKALGEIVAMAVDPGTRVLYLVDNVGPAGTDFGHRYDDDDVDHDAEEGEVLHGHVHVNGQGHGQGHGQGQDEDVDDVDNEDVDDVNDGDEVRVHDVDRALDNARVLLSPEPAGSDMAARVAAVLQALPRHIVKGFNAVCDVVHLTHLSRVRPRSRVWCLKPDQPDRLELVREVPFGADAAALMPCPSVPSLQLLAVRDGLTSDWDVAEMAATTPPGTCQTCAPYVRPLAADFQALLGTADGADVTLVVGPNEKEFRAHRAVLLARCAFFRPFLLGGFYVRVERESSMRIRLPDDTPVIFERILEHLYSGSAQHVPQSDLLETAAAADRFMLFEFRNALLARTTTAMTPGTFVQTLAAMRRLATQPPEELMRAALRYYVDNQEPILRDHEASVGALIAQEPGLVLELLGAVASGSASGSAGPQTRPHKRRRHLEA